MATRRKTGPDIPEGVIQWFDGRASIDAAGWFALLPDEESRLLGWWRDWLTAHPGATPPTDAGWIRWPARTP